MIYLGYCHDICNLSKTNWRDKVSIGSFEHFDPWSLRYCSDTAIDDEVSSLAGGYYKEPKHQNFVLVPREEIYIQPFYNWFNE